MRKIFLLAAVILISACISGGAVYSIKFAGTDVNFRADLTKAEKVLLEPGPEEVRKVFFENPVELVRIAFVPSEENNGFYSVAGFELQYKTVLAYKQFIFTDNAIFQKELGKDCVYFEKRFSGAVATQRRICFEVLILNETSEAFSLANESAPIILMEAGAEGTKVSVENNVVRIMGKDMSQNNRKYTDLDLAADKFLLVLLNESAKKN